MSSRGTLLAFGLALACAFGPAVPEASADADGHVPEVVTGVTMLEHPEKPVVAYTLRAKLEPVAHTVHGEGTLRWTNTSTKPVSELWFHLYLNGFKNQSSVFMRAPVGGFRGSTIPHEWGTIDVSRLSLLGGEGKTELWPKAELHRPDDEDETDARVPLPRAVEPGETITLEMAWDDKLPAVVERTGFEGSFHMVAQWFPKIARLEADGTWAHFPFHHLGEFYADFGKYDVTLDVPSSFLVGATGPIVDTKTENGRRIEHHVQDDIHDFAWTAWDKFQTRSEKIDGVDVTILYPPSYEGHAERELATMRFALPYYGARYGKYPYGVLTLVHPPSTAPEAGGMEYPTLITTGGASYHPDGLRLVELVTIHEFGHQYFYGLLASHETNWPFLDEGLNSYAEGEAMGTWKGKGSVVDLFGLRISDQEGQAERARHPVHDDKVAQPAYAYGTGGTYGSLVYSRTATILETMRRVYGDPAMQKAIGTYTRRFRFRHPTPDDLVATMRSELGEAAGRFLQKALFEKGWIDFAVTSVSSHSVRTPAGIFDKGGQRTTVKPEGRGSEGKYQGWALVVRRGDLVLPVDIELIAEDGTRTRVPWDGATDWIRVPYNGSSPLRAVVVDPDTKVLLDQNPENDFATAPGHSGGGAPGTLERATYWSELVMGALAP
ncbi:MAG: M1 family metallopeptidase [Deltaproteobacteria bacterium]|nr:M1 family metallopeptidase [Deltaproteobacteria bacterium]